MSRFLCMGVWLCVALSFFSSARAKEYVIRCDVLEVEYAEGDDHGLDEPASTKLRHVEVKVQEESDFTVTRVDDGWNMAASGTVAGLKDGRLVVKQMSFAYGPDDGTSRNTSFQGEHQISSKATFVGGALVRRVKEPPYEKLSFYSFREVAKSDEENDQQCEAIRQTILAEVAERRKERAVDLDVKTKASSRLLELAKQQLANPNDEAAGRVLLELVIQKFPDTPAGREAKKTWNALPNVKHKYSNDF